MADRDDLRELPAPSVVALRPARLAEAASLPRPPMTPVAIGPGLRCDPLPASVERSVDQYPVSRAKVMPPPLREATLSRDRLLDWLERHIHRRCITVVAETGFGKTTLMTDFSRRAPVPCLWYRLDAGDRDPISFLNYVVAAAREVMPTFGVQTLALLGDMLTTRPSTDLIVSTLISELFAFADRSTVLIFDDYHVVDEDPRARALITRLLAEAPDRMSFVLLSRRPPRLALGRLAARGEAPRLGADDLRFSSDETERLFRDIYHQPLETEVLRQVEARTEGWVAGLQLLHSSIRGRSPRDVRAFVGSVSGAEGDLYDYLAEEVMSELTPEVQRFLTYTSILDDVRIELSTAIFAADDPPPSQAEVQAWADVGHQAGLMARHSALSSSRRYHPLMREFLERRLELLVTQDQLRGMHLRVARTAEATDWLTSCRHYIKADCESDALRVLVANAAKVLGSGQWGDGAGLIRTLHASDEDPRIAVILAREDIYAGRMREGLARLERFDLSQLDGPTRGLVVLGLVHGQWWMGLMGAETDVRPLVSDPSVPEDIRAIARGILVTVATTTTGRLAELVDELVPLARSHEAANLYFYAGIGRHNLAYTRLLMGDYSAAIEDGHQALALFAKVPGPVEERYAVHFGLTRSYFELNDHVAARHHLDRAIEGATIGAVEQWFEAATFLPLIGELGRAKELLAKGLAHPTKEIAQNCLGAMFAVARHALAEGKFDEAAEAMGQSYRDWPATTTCSWGLWLDLRANIDVARRRYGDAQAWIDEGTGLAVVQGSGLLEGRFRLLRALGDNNQAQLQTALAAATSMELLSSAEAIVRSLHRVPEVPEALRVSIAAWPGRWLPLLRSVVATPTDLATVAAARLLDEHGELADVRTLRALAKSRVKGLKGSDIGRGLARRRSPQLTVRDLGRAKFSVGYRHVQLASIRRRSAGLLCYLLTRKGHLATRDQVLDALWPDTDPEAAVNSLNQTLYFLRRDIEPSYDDDVSAQYTHFEADLVWLDRDLVRSESAEFHERAARALGAMEDLDGGVATLGTYHGRFAPEFEYEEWASGWRELLHGQYLHLAESLVARLIRDNKMVEAADLAVQVLQVDSGAEHLERELIWLYGMLGARSAAAEQYGHYAAVQRTEYGVEPPTLDEIMTAG